MRNFMTVIMLSGIVLLGACTNVNHLEEPVITSDKTTLSVGETITFIATTNSDDFECAGFEISKGIDIEPYYEEENLTPRTEYTFKFTPTEPGNYAASITLWVKCGSDQGNHYIFSGLPANFTVVE